MPEPEPESQTPVEGAETARPAPPDPADFKSLPRRRFWRDEPKAQAPSDRSGPPGLAAPGE